MKPSSLLLSIACAVALALATVCRAEESGSGHYSPGQTASFIDALPGYPSIAVVNYFTYYDGNGGGSGSLPLGGNVAANASATV